MKALARYEEVLAHAKHDEDAVRTVDMVKKTIRQAKITKYEATLMFHFRSEKDLNALRTKVQSEIKDMRKALEVSKESDLLHATLAKRVKDALVMKTVEI